MSIKREHIKNWANMSGVSYSWWMPTFLIKRRAFKALNVSPKRMTANDFRNSLLSLGGVRTVKIKEDPFITVVLVDGGDYNEVKKHFNAFKRSGIGAMFSLELDHTK